MKTAGIIGGLGPTTTAEFYLKLIHLSESEKAAARPPLLIWSVPALYATENDAMRNGVVGPYLAHLTEGAQLLERGGADFVVLPCNSLHVFIADIQNAVHIPVLSIINETTKHIKEEGISKVGLLSTSITQKNNLYGSFFEKSDIVCQYPTEKEQAALNEIIYKLVTNTITEEDKKTILEVIDTFAKGGIEHVVLACTDLQLLKPSHPQLTFHDSMEILAHATFKNIME